MDVMEVEKNAQSSLKDYEIDIRWKDVEEMEKYKPSYNISKFEKVYFGILYSPSIVCQGDKPSIVNAQFGMSTSHSSPGDSFATINCREETMKEKVFFKNSYFNNRRCVIICNG